MIHIVNLILTEGLLYHVGQFTILIDTNKLIFIYFHKITLLYRYFTVYKVDIEIAWNRFDNSLSQMWDTFK